MSNSVQFTLTSLFPFLNQVYSESRDLNAPFFESMKHECCIWWGCILQQVEISHAEPCDSGEWLREDAKRSANKPCSLLHYFRILRYCSSAKYGNNAGIVVFFLEVGDKQSAWIQIVSANNMIYLATITYNHICHFAIIPSQNYYHLATIMRHIFFFTHLVMICLLKAVA